MIRTRTETKSTPPRGPSTTTTIVKPDTTPASPPPKATTSTSPPPTNRRRLLRQSTPLTTSIIRNRQRPTDSDRTRTPTPLHLRSSLNRTVIGSRTISGETRSGSLPIRMVRCFRTRRDARGRYRFPRVASVRF